MGIRFQNAACVYPCELMTSFMLYENQRRNRRRLVGRRSADRSPEISLQLACALIYLLSSSVVLIDVELDALVEIEAKSIRTFAAPAGGRRSVRRSSVPPALASPSSKFLRCS